jgi:hypothetical protein
MPPSSDHGKAKRSHHGEHTLLPQNESIGISPLEMEAGVSPNTRHTVSFNLDDSASNNDNDTNNGMSDDDTSEIVLGGVFKVPSLRIVALQLSLYVNVFITIVKLIAYLQTWSLSVLAALLDSVLDVVSQLVLNYTEKHSSLQRSSAVYPAGARYVSPYHCISCDMHCIYCQD